LFRHEKRERTSGYPRLKLVLETEWKKWETESNKDEKKGRNEERM
jgi:hypothetical protein